MWNPSGSSVEDGAIHGRLRRATAERHDHVDRGLAYLLSERLSVGRYVDLLAALFGFYAPLETDLARWEAASGPLALPLRRRAPLLTRDLRAFGRAAEQISTCTTIPTLISVEHVAGALYVVEGAALGGQVIARAVPQRLGVGRDNGAAFFIGDGADTAARWRRVLAWLDERDRDPRVIGNEIVDAATRTFDALSQWLKAREVLDE